LNVGVVQNQELRSNRGARRARRDSGVGVSREMSLWHGSRHVRAPSGKGTCDEYCRDWLAGALHLAARHPVDAVRCNSPDKRTALMAAFRNRFAIGFLIPLCGFSGAGR
ncbi:MAG TPA: hypothetical protein VFG55_00350, partial [Rhodanobacteraceae bacterium]|nr:hypothetical protein [Rhodanobacteraceae bacterium]